MSVTYDMRTPEPPRLRWYQRRGLLAAVAGVVLAVGFAGVAFGQQNGDRPDSPAQSAFPPAPGGLLRSTVAAGQGAQSQLNHVPVMYPRTKEGAVQAATNYSVALAGPLMFNQVTRPEVIRTVYAPEVTLKRPRFDAASF
jgi:hypothetical protein